MADDNVDQRLAQIEAALLTFPTKADLAEMATKADLAGLAEQVQRLRDDVLALKADLAATNAIAYGSSVSPAG
jgi:hypothetical protein